MRVRLRIESVTVEGFGLSNHQEPALRAALAAELANLFAREERFLPSHTRNLAAWLPEPAPDQAEALANGIGRAVHGSVPRHAK